MRILTLVLSLMIASQAVANDYHKAAARYAAGCVVNNIYLLSESSNGGTTWLAKCPGHGEVVIVCDYAGQCQRAG